MISSQRPRRLTERSKATCELRALDFENISSTGLFETLSGMQAVGESTTSSASIAEQRGYSEQELFATAEIGYHYLRSGGSKLARVLFEGLVAVSPAEPYFRVALGLACDHEGDRAAAFAHYQRALHLAPLDPRPELNLAEFFIESGDHASARRHLDRASTKASGARDVALAKKARALLSLLSGSPK